MKDNIDAIQSNDLAQRVPFYKYERVYGGKKYIIYSLFYPYNGEYNILGLENAGEHGGDAEHITFELSNDGKVSRIYFGAHGDSDGRWLNEKDVSKEGGQYVAHIAYHGHGFYPEQGTYFRNYGLSNDYTNKGKYMSTLINPVINIPSKDTLTTEQKNNVGLAYYCGMIGENGIDSYYRKGWFNNIDKEENPPKLINNTLFVSVRAVIFVFIASLILYLFLLGRKLNNFNTFAPYVYYLGFISLFIFGIYKLKQIIRSFS